MLLQDLLYSWRNLSKTPGFLVVTVLSLALGIGANTALFSLLYSALYKTLPVDDPQLLVLFNDPAARGVHRGTSNGERDMLSWPEFQDLHQITALQGIFAVQTSLPKNHIHVGSSNEDARIKMVSGTYFSVLGITPQAGRFFDESVDRQIGSAPYIVLSDDYWARRFGRSPEAIGKTIIIQKTAFDVIGIGPRGFSGENVGQNPDFWVPLSMQMQVIPGMDFLHPMSDPVMKTMWLHVFGRLRPGANLATAQTQANAIFKASLEQSYQSLSEKTKRELMDQHLKLRPASTGVSTLRTQFAESLYVIFAAVGAVLLICCANLSNLLLARANARQREITVRLALGASKFRVARQLFTEGLLLSFFGAIGGLLLSQAMARPLLQMASTGRDVIHLDVTLDWRVMLFTGLIAITTTLICSLLPSFRAAQTPLITTLREGGRGTTSSRSKLTAGRLFVAAQVALSLVLLVGAGLFLRTLLNLQRVDLGYEKNRLAVVNVSASAAGYKTAEFGQLFRTIQQKLQSTPGVQAATFSMNGLFSGSESGDNIGVEGYTPTDKDDSDAAFDSVGPNYFSSLGIPLQQGREIQEADTANAPKVCVINDAFAHKFFAGRNPIGKHITDQLGDRSIVFEIVGVARNTRDHSLRDKIDPRFFVSFLQRDFGSDSSWANFEVRLAAGDGSGLNQIKHAIQLVDPNLEVETRFLARSLDEQLDQERLMANLVTLFGALALALAAVGIYGILAYGVSQRTSEIGVRMAIGAGSSDVINMIAKETLWMITCGLVAGLVATFFLTRLVESKLFGVTATDPLVAALSIALLAVVGLLAATLPAFRASRIDPAIALRDE